MNRDPSPPRIPAPQPPRQHPGRIESFFVPRLEQIPSPPHRPPVPQPNLRQTTIPWEAMVGMATEPPAKKPRLDPPGRDHLTALFPELQAIIVGHLRLGEVWPLSIASAYWATHWKSWVTNNRWSEMRRNYYPNPTADDLGGLTRLTRLDILDIVGLSSRSFSRWPHLVKLHLVHQAWHNYPEEIMPMAMPGITSLSVIDLGQVSWWCPPELFGHYFPRLRSL